MATAVSMDRAFITANPPTYHRSGVDGQGPSPDLVGIRRGRTRLREQDRSMSLASSSLASGVLTVPGGQAKLRPTLFDLPPELIHQILTCLPARDLACVSATCRSLAAHGRDDLLWADLVHRNLPSKLPGPGPFDSFRSLYRAHYPYWFVPRQKIWFSDAEHTGKLILARYDHRRGVIEGYRVVAEKTLDPVTAWARNRNVIVQTYNPKVRLWLDDPVILLKNNAVAPPSRGQYLYREIQMPMAAEAQHVYSSFSLCARQDGPSSPSVCPNRQWPPMTIPSENRVQRNVGSPSYSRPQHLGQISEYAFRIRKWAHFPLTHPSFTMDSPENMTTYATLDAKLYTPTTQKPYQGIWVGDSVDHGCEFLLFLQRERDRRQTRDQRSARPARGAVPESAAEGPSRDVSLQGVTATGAEGDQRSNELAIEQGSLEGIKLTGDLFVPRGEISFIAEVGPKGVIRVADEEPFRGVRVVRCKSQVVSRNPRDSRFIDSQLFLISHDCIAQYCQVMSRFSFFYRVDIDTLLQI